jgi:glycosyltransferase involved in cell wall biosynthesis
MARGGIDIGIVVPAYNVAGYVEGFFACLKEQTYQGFRVVVVDDCSLDGTLDLCVREGSWLGERLSLLHNERNLGPGQTRNRGLEELCLDPPTYVTFLDVDDWFEPAYLEDLHSAAVDFGADLSVAGIVRFEEGSGRVLATEMVSYPTRLFEDSSSIDELAFLNPCAYAKLYRFERICHVRFRTMRRSEDTCWLFEALPHLKSVKFTNHALYHYRVRANSLSGSMSADAYQDMHREFADCLRLFDTEEHAPYRELFECQVFIRSSIGGVMRLAFHDMPRTFLLAREERAWLDAHMPAWRTNKYLSFGRRNSTNKKQLALKLCASLYKCHAFALFIVAYYVVSQVLRREVRA